MSESNWIEWPVCPQCERRRQTVCSVCGTAGIEFDLAEYLAPAEHVCETRANEEASAPASEELEVLLMCPQCDEVFKPRFYRLCAQCGFDFGAGIEIAQSESTPLPPRVVWTILGLAAFGLSLLAYFWWLLS